MVDSGALSNDMGHTENVEMSTTAEKNLPVIEVAESSPVKLDPQGPLKEIKTLSVSVVVTNADRANVQPVPIDQEEEKEIDERWKKKMRRASTIVINEDDHPCWEEVDEIWKEFCLTSD